MKRKKKSFSLRGYRFIDGFIWEIFDFFHLPHQNKDLYQCAWVAFLSAYQERPLSFSRTNSPGWMRAYHIIWDALAKEQKRTNIWRYKYTSADQPARYDIPTPLIELQHSRHGDFQNSVCFHDYLAHLGPDTRLMAYGLIHGDTIEEIQSYLRWDYDHTHFIYNDLREKMEEYLRI